MNVLVVGNGFDLDLGLHTTYRDFAESPYWNELYKPQNSWGGKGLADFIKCQSREKEWFDVEECLAFYVKDKENKQDFSFAQQDKYFLRDLERQLTEFLSNELSQASFNVNSLANKVIQTQKVIKCFDSIYSFNYTEYDYLDVINDNMDCLYGVVRLHCMRGNIILGIEENACKSKEYSFVKKVCHPLYPSTRIIPDLVNATNVIIFGHSLNNFDYKYFKQYFISLKQDILAGKDRFIYIISKDDDSIKLIKDNLCEHNVSITELSSALKFISTERYEYEWRDEVEEVENMISKLKEQ